jgi:RND family efflux transporter MFP subunit
MRDPDHEVGAMVRAVVCLLAVSILTGLNPAAVGAEEPRPVRVQTVSFTAAQDSITYPGTVQARVQASLGFRIGGKVIERLVDIGDHVITGQVLARLDPVDPQLALEADAQVVRAAEAEAVNARADFQRYQRMGRGSPAFLPSEFDKRQAALDGAEARLTQAQRQLTMANDQLVYTTLRADADGVITGLRLEVGQVVPAGQTAFTLAHTAETEIVVDVPENRLPNIRAAQTVSIGLWSQPDKLLTGRVREIGALADAVSRTFMVKVTIVEPPPDTLGLGMTASVRFARPARQQVAILPASAVVSINGIPSVWVLDPAAQRAVARPVTVAAWSGDGDVSISAGVDSGAQVVTAGAALLDSSIPVIAWAGAIR